MILELADVTYRYASSEDAHFLFELYANTRTEELDAWGWDSEQQDAFLKMQFHAQQTSYQKQFPNSNYQIVLMQQVTVGAILVNRNETEIRLADIAILPEYRDRGIGSFLLQNLIREATQAGKPIRLQVIQFNRATLLYQRLGFVKVGDNGTHFLMEWQPPRVATLK